MLSLCQRIHAPVKPSKIEGSTIHLTFLGIIIVTLTMIASISEEFKQDLISSLQLMLQHRKCTKCQLFFLIDKFSFACKVIPAGRIFLCRQAAQYPHQLSYKTIKAYFLGICLECGHNCPTYDELLCVLCTGTK